MKKQFAPTAVLFVSLVIVMIGFGIAIPLMPFYVTHFNASASALGLMMSLYSLMQFAFAPVWGRLSDRIGRKPVLLVGVIGYFVSFMMQGLAQSLTGLIVARTLAGILTSATLPTAMAYIADITSEENRSKGIGLMGAAMGVGMIFGPMLGGLLTGVTLPLPPALAGLLQITRDNTTGGMINLSIPFFASALLALLAVPFIIGLLPESLSPEQRQVKPVVKEGSRSRQLLQGIAGPEGFLYLMAFVLAFSLASMESVLGMYGQQRFSMGPTQVGLLMGGVGVLAVLQQGLVIGPLTRRFGEEGVIRGGLAVSAVGFCLLALAYTPWMLAASAMVFTSGSVLLQPSVSSLVSKRARGGQGAAMGLNNSFQSLGRGVGPLWAGFAYDINYTLSFWSGALIQLASLVYSIKTLKAEGVIFKPTEGETLPQR